MDKVHTPLKVFGILKDLFQKVLKPLRERKTVKFMIIKEDSFPLTAGFDIIIPMGVTQRDGEEPRVTCYGEAYDAAQWLESLDPDKIFTSETLRQLTSMLSERACEWGYESETALCTVYSIYNKNDLNKSVILPSSEPFMPDTEYENLTDCEPDPTGEGLLCFATVVDGKILSAASENPHEEGDTVIDIGVETVPRFRSNGYATSNVAALAYYLLDPGIKVTYIAEDNNPASARVAEKAGFRKETRELRFICRKK